MGGRVGRDILWAAERARALEGGQDGSPGDVVNQDNLRVRRCEERAQVLVRVGLARIWNALKCDFNAKFASVA
jgi:hypothetical protein